MSLGYGWPDGRGHPKAHADLALELRHFSKVSALDERHSFAGPKALGRLNKDFAIASARSHARNNDLVTHSNSRFLISARRPKLLGI
jgi:hypothetical protein